MRISYENEYYIKGGGGMMDFKIKARCDYLTVIITRD